MGQLASFWNSKKGFSKQIVANKGLAKNIAYIVKCIKLTKALDKKDIFSPSKKMLAQNSVVREERLTGDGAIIHGQKKVFKWPPSVTQNTQKSAKLIKNWTTTNKAGDVDANSRVVPEIAQIFLKEKRNKVKSREAGKHGTREKKRTSDSKKSNAKKKVFKSKIERPISSEKHRDPEKILYNEDDRQNRLKKSYFVKSNELPYQNAAGFAKLMKELKDKFNNKPSQETKEENGKNIIPNTKDKIDNARKKLYSILDRKPETKIQNVSKQRVRIFSSCEIREEKEKTEKVTPSTKSTPHFLEKTSSQRKIRSIFNPDSLNKTQMKSEESTELEKKSTSARTKFRSKIKNFENNIPPIQKNLENLKSKTPEKRFRSSNGNSRIYFYKKNLPFFDEGGTISNSLDPNQFRVLFNKIEASRQKSIDNIMKLESINSNKKKRAKWILDENKSWKKINV